jgi:hypothetical protein
MVCGFASGTGCWRMGVAIMAMQQRREPAPKRVEVKIDRSRFPARFMDLHFVEFVSWRMNVHPTRDFRLRWPPGSRGRNSETLRIGFVVEGRGTPNPTVRIVPARPEDEKTLVDYMAAIGRADQEYIQDKLQATVATALADQGAEWCGTRPSIVRADIEETGESDERL